MRVRTTGYWSPNFLSLTRIITAVKNTAFWTLDVYCPSLQKKGSCGIEVSSTTFGTGPPVVVDGSKRGGLRARETHKISRFLFGPSPYMTCVQFVFFRAENDPKRWLLNSFKWVISITGVPMGRARKARTPLLVVKSGVLSWGKSVKFFLFSVIVWSSQWRNKDTLWG